MLYSFNISEQRSLQAANYCYFDSPYMHPTRNMAVHDLIFMIDGEWEIGIGREIYKMQKNDVLMLPANITHCGIKPCAPKTRTMYLHIYSSIKDGGTDGEAVEGSLLLNNFVSTSEAPNIKALFKKIIGAKDDPHVSGAYIVTLLYELSELSHIMQKTSPAQAVRNYAVSLSRIPTNGEIAAHFHVSKRTVETQFKKQYGTTVHEYILSYKLEEGKQYLLDYPDIKLRTIANNLGFYDEYHFSRMFKRAFGLSPKEFRSRKAAEEKAKK